MVLHTKIEPKLSQKLLLTPSLQQAIKLLQLNRLELRAALSEALQQNPLLEEILAPPGDEETMEKTPNGEDLTIETWLQQLDDMHPYHFSSSGNIEPPSEGPLFENIPAPQEALVDYLLWQIQLLEIDPFIKEKAILLVGELDEDGYLFTPLQTLAEEHKVPIADIEEALKVIHSLDPPGVGARSHQECLLLQAQDPLIHGIFRDCWDHFINQDYQTIKKKYHLSDEAWEVILEAIRHLDLYPGRKYNQSRPVYVEPDVYVVRKGSSLAILLNDDNLPHLRISPYYLHLYKISQRKGDKETVGYIQKKLRSALWLLRSVEQRHYTLYKVMEAIVAFQRGFFDEGEEALRPLTLKDVAQKIEMHESTVSRVVVNKYVQTPRGLLPIKYFFRHGLKTMTGTNLTVRTIKKLMENLIRQEPKDKPYSDAKISQLMLERYEIAISRRTVTKYREELGIPASKERKH